MLQCHIKQSFSESMKKNLFEMCWQQRRHQSLLFSIHDPKVSNQQPLLWFAHLGTSCHMPRRANCNNSHWLDNTCILLSWASSSQNVYSPFHNHLCFTKYFPNNLFSLHQWNNCWIFRIWISRNIFFRCFWKTAYYIKYSGLCQYTHPPCFMFCGLSTRTVILMWRSSGQPLVVRIRCHSGLLELLTVGRRVTWWKKRAFLS